MSSVFKVTNLFLPPSSSGDFQAYEAALKDQSPSKMINMTSISTNLVDEIWDDQPSYNSETVITVLDAAKYTGMITTGKKMKQI